MEGKEKKVKKELKEENFNNNNQNNQNNKNDKNDNDNNKEEEEGNNEENEEKYQSINQNKVKRSHQLMQLLRKKLPSVIRGRRELIDKNAKFATLCVLDAFQGRMSNGLATNSKKSKLMFNIFCIQTSDWFLNLVILSSIIHTFMIFLEPKPEECSTFISILISITHIIIFIIHFLDVALKMIYQGFWEYLDHDWQFLYGITVSLHFFDLLYFWRTTLTNPLRPVIGLLRDRSFRRFFSVVKLMIPCLSETLAPLIAFLVIISVITNVIFSSEFLNIANDITDDSLRQINYDWLWLVLTNDTFIRLFPETAENNVFYVIFFFTVLYIGQRFILSVILGATFETFTQFTSEQVKKEKLKEYQGLTKAFAVLDDTKTGYISDIVFFALMKNLEPSYQREEIGLYYELISGGNSKGVSILQFLSLNDVLSFKFIRKGTVSIHESKQFIFNYLEKYQENVTLPFSSFNSSKTIQYITNKCLELFDKKRIIMYSNWLDIFLLSFGILDYQIFELNLQNTFLHLPNIIITPCILMRCLNIFEYCCRIIDKKGKLFSLLLEIKEIYTIIFLIGSIGIILLDLHLYFHSFCLIHSIHLPFILIPFSTTTTTTIATTTIATTTTTILSSPSLTIKIIRVMFRCFRVIRVFQTNTDLASFLDAILSVAPIFFQNMGFAFIVTYIFAMIGKIWFGSYIPTFSTPAYAMITVLKLFLPYNFLDVLEEVMEKVHPITIIYFLTYFLMSIIISNLSLSIIIEWYSDSLKDKSRDKTKEDEEYEHLFHTIVSRARVRNVFSVKNGEHAYYDNIRMVKSHDSESDHRLKFVEKGTMITKSDLKKCQKYSNINLIEFYDLQSKELKKLTWEADFVKELLESKVGTVKKFSNGETLCYQGTPALECFILISGLIEIRMESSNKKRKDIVIKSLQLLGGMCLSPDGYHNHTCIAVSDDVECIVITRDAIMHDIEQHIIGQFMRIYYKTNEDINKLSIEKLTKKPLRLSTFGKEPSR